MTTQNSNMFTPEAMLAAPRRSPGVPNSAGTHVLYSVSTYSFEAHEKTKEIRILDLDNGRSILVTNDEKASEPHWIEDNVLWFKKGENESTVLVVAEGDDMSTTYTAAVIPAAVSDAKLKILENGKIAFAVSAAANLDGTLYNSKNEPKKYSSGLVYDSLMVRHWDKYVFARRNSIWYGLLERKKPLNAESKGRYNLSPLINALKGTHLESPMAPFPDSSHYDIGKNGIIFVAKDPSINAAYNTKCDLYFLPISDFSMETQSELQKVEMEGLEGAASNPTFSPDGHAVAFLKMKQNGYESDKNRIVLIPDISKTSVAIEVLKSHDGAGLWDRSPSGLAWSNNGKTLYLVAGNEGNTLLYKVDIPATPADIHKPPQSITSTGSISDVQPLGTRSSGLFLTSTNIVDNSLYSTIDPSNPSTLKHISSNSRNGTFFGLSPSQVSDIWFQGAGDYKVHAWVIKPSNFDASKKYPLAYLVHGGPQRAWRDFWSTRWNLAVFAEQGYVVVCPNITGSTGYGQAFTDAITGNWGGSPYVDLLKGFNYIKEELSYVDTSRSIALGASYGGYMMNWIQGHPLGREFKALVCHDGMFSTFNAASQEEQWFPNHDLKGPLWHAQSEWEKWDPARFTGEWKTPELIIHSELDYRLPITEGLAAFNVLQERGVESRFLTFPDENHWVLKEENSLVWYTVVLNWINKYVGLPAYKEDGKEGFEVQSRPVLGRESGLVIR